VWFLSLCISKLYGRLAFIDFPIKTVPAFSGQRPEAGARLWFIVRITKLVTNTHDMYMATAPRMGSSLLKPSAASA
jgi:hypothetical protein